MVIMALTIIGIALSAILLLWKKVCIMGVMVANRGYFAVFGTGSRTGQLFGTCQETPTANPYAFFSNTESEQLVRRACLKCM